MACHNLLSMLIQLLHCPVRSQMSTAHPGRLNYLCRRFSQLMPGSCSPAPEVLCLTYTVLIFIIFLIGRILGSPVYQSPYRILLTDSLGSFTWSLWPLAVFEFVALDEGVKVWGTWGMLGSRVRWACWAKRRECIWHKLPCIVFTFLGDLQQFCILKSSWRNFFHLILLQYSAIQ